MWYDWMVGGWGARNGRDGWGGTGPVFGVQLGTQPFEGQERLSPVLTTGHEFRQDSGGPGQNRGGMGVEKGGTLMLAERTVMSYCCDRERSITWGLWGGLPSIPHGVWVNPGQGPERERYLGSIFSNVPIAVGRHVHAAVSRRRRPRRPTRPRRRRGARRRDRRLRVHRACTKGLRRRWCARSMPTLRVRGRPRRDRARARSNPRPSGRAGWTRIRSRSPSGTAMGSSTCST